MNKKMKETMLGGIKQNPVLIMALAMCPVLAVTSDVVSALGMGVAVLFVMFMSTLLISALRKIIPGKIRLPIFVVIIATFVTLVKMVLRAFTPDLYDTLGGFIDLIVVNCVVFARVDGFAKNNNVLYTMVDSTSMSVGFILALVVMATVKEIIGLGTFAGLKIMDFKISFFQSSAGSLMTLALLMGAFVAVSNAIKNKKSKPAAEVATEPAAEVTE